MASHAEQIELARQELKDAKQEMNLAQSELDTLRQKLQAAESRFERASLRHSQAKEYYGELTRGNPCQWNNMYQKLLEWKEEHGTCLVPGSKDASEEQRALSKWVMNQRVFYKYFMNGDKKHIREDRIEMLNELGFVWDAVEHAWTKNIEQLRQYYEEHGNFDVPRKHDQKLNGFVCMVRSAKRRKDEGLAQKELTDSRIEKLNSINFIWDVQNPRRLRPPVARPDFDSNIELLRDFKRTYGHVKIWKMIRAWNNTGEEPAKKKEYKRLGDFVTLVRKEHEKYLENKPCSLDEEKIHRLTEVGVEFRRPASEPRLNTGRDGERSRRKRRKKNDVDENQGEEIDTEPPAAESKTSETDL